MSLEENWETLKILARKTVGRVEKKRITDAEAFTACSETTEATIRNSEIQTQNRVVDLGVGFRIVSEDGRVGFACTNRIDEDAVQAAAEAATGASRACSKVFGFAPPREEKLSRLEGLIDPRIRDVDAEEAADIAKRMVEAAESFDNRVIAKDGRVAFEYSRRAVMNTRGVDFEEGETRAIIYLGGSGEQNGEVTGSCYDLMLKHTLDLDPELVGENAAKMVVMMLKPRRLASFEGPVLFGSEAASGQLSHALIDALKGENIAAGRSAWTTGAGQKVAAENFTLTDDATLEAGFASRSFDDEGAVSRKTVLIQNGVLKNFLLDSAYSERLEMQNTGNASRYSGGFDLVRAIIGNSYRTRPEIYPSNLIIEAGSKTKEELVSETEKGVLVESMAGFAQPGSGVISAQLSHAFFIEKGEVKFPLKGTMVSGVAFDWLRKVSSTSKDAKQYWNAVAPSVLVEDVKIIGA